MIRYWRDWCWPYLRRMRKGSWRAWRSFLWELRHPWDKVIDDGDPA